MPTVSKARAEWRDLRAARVGAGHFALIQGGDGAWRVALVDEWAIERKALQAAFDAVNPDGSLDYCGDFLSVGSLPQDLGRADIFFAERQRECEQIDMLWNQEAASVLAAAHPRWRAWAPGAIPSLIRAKAVYRLWEVAKGAPTPEMARVALAGSLQENIELCASRAAGLTEAIQHALDVVDASAAKSKAARRQRRAMDSKEAS
jgi:hypothetical protein